MKLIINTIDGGHLAIEDFDQSSLTALLEEWDNEPSGLLTFALDAGMAYIPKASVSRIDAND